MFNLWACVWVDASMGDAECVRLARTCETQGDGSMGDACETKGNQAAKCIDEHSLLMAHGS